MRESGYYRVKYDGKPIIAMYTLSDELVYIGGKWVKTVGYWSLCGNKAEYQDSDFEAIDENRIDPEPEFKHKEGSRYQFYHITDDRKYAVYNERDKEGYNIEHVVEISRTKEFNKLVSKYPLT